MNSCFRFFLYHEQVNTYLLLMYLTKNIIKVMNLFEQSLLFTQFPFNLLMFDVHVMDFLLDFLPASTQWKCIGNINSAQNWIKRWVQICPCSCNPHYLLFCTIPWTWKAIHHIQQQILKSHYEHFNQCTCNGDEFICCCSLKKLIK